MNKNGPKKRSYLYSKLVFCPFLFIFIWEFFAEPHPYSRYLKKLHMLKDQITMEKIAH